MIKLTLKFFIIVGYKICFRLANFTVTRMFNILVEDVEEGCNIAYPLYLKGSKYIRIGKNFSAQPGLRIEAWDEYLGTKHHPQILIGNNVAIGFNVHIGAISGIEIGNDVLIGSNVLITDHQHGRLTFEENNIPAINRPLHSKGKVVIEDNVWIGDGVCIMDGVRIGKNSIIGANAVVTKNISEASVAAGIPAKILRKIH
jgi:acetyltransferase-like isoleucine patch superfamily enzyme